MISFIFTRIHSAYTECCIICGRLRVFDKKTNELIELKYFNFKNQDILQVGFADLSGQDLNDLLIAGELGESSIHRSGAAITTFTTSTRSGIEAVNYKVSEQDAAHILSIPDLAGRPPCPDIQLFPDGKVKVPLKYPFTILEEEHPELNAKIKNAVKFTSSEDGSIILNLNGHDRKLINPDTKMTTLLQHTDQAKNESDDVNVY